jgi:hypothetical protein
VDREALRPIIVAIICVLVISVAAATLTSPVDTESGGDGPGVGGPTGPDGTAEEGGGGGGEATGNGSANPPTFPVLCVSVLSGPAPFWIAVGVLLVTGAALTRRYDAIVAFGLTLGLGVVLLLLVGFLWSGCPDMKPATPEMPSFLPGNNSSAGGSGGLGGGGEGDVTDPTAPSILLFAILLLTVVLVVVLFLFTDADVTSDGDTTADETDAERRTAIGQAAGRAADRIEDADDLENEVYRAWREMTDHLEVDRPESSTPKEFADAAVDAGMSDGDVDELTKLFEEVRYGGKDPTDDRETRALAALRRIETEYADDGGDW